MGNMYKLTMVKNNKFSWVLNITLVVVIYFGIQYYNKSTVRTGELPFFTAVTLDGERIISTQFREKPFLIHFWATWCSICHMERNSIDAIAKDYNVITVASQSTLPDVTNYMKENKLSFNVVVDESGELTKIFGIKAFPTSLFIDNSGHITFIEVGYTTEIGLRARLKML